MGKTVELLTQGKINLLCEISNAGISYILEDAETESELVKFAIKCFHDCEQDLIDIVSLVNKTMENESYKTICDDFLKNKMPDIPVVENELWDIYVIDGHLNYLSNILSVYNSGLHYGVQ